MDKEKLIKVFVIENLMYIPIFAIFSIILIIADPSKMMITTCISMMIGLGIGILFNHFVQIPKVYGKKDERQLILQIVAITLSLGVGFVASFIILVLVGSNIIIINHIQTLFIALAIALFTFIVRLVSYKILDSTL